MKLKLRVAAAQHPQSAVRAAVSSGPHGGTGRGGRKVLALWNAGQGSAGGVGAMLCGALVLKSPQMAFHSKIMFSVYVLFVRTVHLWLLGGSPTEVYGLRAACWPQTARRRVLRAASRVSE